MNDQQTMQDILRIVLETQKEIAENREIIDFLKDNIVTKDDLTTVENRLDKKIDGVKNEMIEHVDGFIKLYQKQESELAAIAHRQNRQEEKLDLVIKHLNLNIA